MGDNKSVRWIYLVIGIIALLFTGIIYAWSILKGSFTDAFGWSNRDLATAYTFTISCFCLGCIAGGFFLHRIGPRRSLLISAAFSFCGFFVVSRMTGSSIATLYLSYGLLAGAGIGIAYNCILGIISLWFPDKKGLSSGILMMGFGASTMIFGNLAAAWMAVPSFGWRKVFLAFSICTGIALCATAFFLRLPTLEEVEGLTGTKSSDANAGKEDAGLSPSQMIKRKSFWKLFAAMTLLGSAGSSVISFARDFAISVGVAVEYAGLLVGILSIANGLGRILAGALYDRYGREFIKFYICVIEILACALCVLTVITGWAPLCVLGFVVVGLSFGSNTSAVSTMIEAFYGPRYYPQNLSLGLLTLLPSSFLAKLSTSLMISTGGYVVPFLCMGIYGVIALLLNMNNKHP